MGRYATVDKDIARDVATVTTRDPRAACAHGRERIAKTNKTQNQTSNHDNDVERERNTERERNAERERNVAL